MSTPPPRKKGQGMSGAATMGGQAGVLFGAAAGPVPAGPSAAEVADLLRANRYCYVDEVELHAGIGQVLDEAGISYRREVYLGPRDRIDLLLAGGLGIEVKIKGQAGDVRRQLQRYAASAEVTALLLVTTRAAHVRGLPVEINEKPLTALLLRGGF